LGKVGSKFYLTEGGKGKVLGYSVCHRDENVLGKGKKEGLDRKKEKHKRESNWENRTKDGE